MATTTERGWFRKRETHAPPLRVLTAASARLNLGDRAETRQQRVLRQGWQSDAWAYRDAIGELRYAVNFLANCTARMKLYPAAYPAGGESENPVALSELGAPPEVIATAQQAMTALGGGRLAVSGLMHSLSTNQSVAGECYLLGMQDEQTGQETWTIRSVDEIVIQNEKYKMREIPSDPQGVIPWIELDPDLSIVARIWRPHPRFRLLADSPMRAILDDCESLTILRRMIRATGRSRLAGRGMLAIPDELSIKVPIDDDADPEADPFMAALAQAMMEPISDEGVASSVVPIVVRGPGLMLDKIQHLDFASKFDAESSKTREELIGIIATGLDLPKEVLEGMADLNHWTAWQVDDNTFRHHVEPHVIECCDALTGAYLRPYMQAVGAPMDWVQRMVLWYDPTELVTHPDQTKDALDLHDRLVLSDEALLKIAGFGEEDRPSKAEIQVRMIEKLRNWPPNLVMAFLHEWDPTLIAPPITESGTIPGIKPTGVDVGTPSPGPQAALPAGAPEEPVPATPDPGPPVVASGARNDHARLSRRLASIDQDLRARLQTAANAAMLRQLERAGARLRTKVAKDETLRTKIAKRPNERVSAILGEDAVTAAGVTAGDLLGNEWDTLRTQFYEWTEAAQKQAIATAIRLGSLAQEADAVTAAETAMTAGRDTGWEVLSTALTNLGHRLLYNPDPNVGPGDWAGLNPDTLVPAGTIRAALAAAGGGDVNTVDPVGQIGTGVTISDLITSAGNVTRTGFEWVHGPALQPFEPHEALDGQQFEAFDDDTLANTSGFPDNAYYFPGDHDGCLCDFMPLFDDAGNDTGE